MKSPHFDEGFFYVCNMENLHAIFLSCSEVCTDTRSITKDSLFFALKGANFNGNQFAEQALELGAKYAVVDEKAYQTKENILLVDDVLKTLQELALFHRRKFSIPVIGITGSNGKTSTKELMAAVLQKKFNTLYTIGNLNNHIGVPLTLLRLNKEHEIAIIEMGANKFKDIEELSAIAEPNYGIITNIGKAHLEGFGSFEGVLKTKKELYEAIQNVKGTLVYNGDDEVLVNNLPAGTTTFSYAQRNEDSFVQGILENLTPYVHFRWKTADYQSPSIATHLVGEYNFYNFLAAVSFGVLFEVPFDQISIALANYIPNNNRSQVQETSRNTVIVDCYNANPTSMTSALNSFAQIHHDKKIAILGDMRELGAEEIREHQKILNLLEDLSIDAILVGSVFQGMGSDYLTFPSYMQLNEFLQTEIIKGAMILLKGSRGIQLEKILPNL